MSPVENPKSRSHAPVVLQYGVHDREYPRNSRVRASLEADGCTVRVAPRARDGGRIARALGDFRGLWSGARGADVVLLSEFRLTHAPLAWLISRLRRARLVVDGFVGLHETAVDDWQSVRPGSLRALRLALADRLAVACADLFLIDTEVRAQQVRRNSPTTPVLALPVGAPSWALPQAPLESTDPLRLLYYGNYIPLHGLDLIADALDRLDGRRSFEVTFLGSGSAREALVRRVAASSWASSATFADPVPAGALASEIGGHHVVLGVFGASRKARTVVANKVWQGLACGRTVVTQDSHALDDIPAEVRPLLVASAPGSADALADTLATVPSRAAIGDEAAARASAAIAERVDDRFAALARWVRA